MTKDNFVETIQAMIKFSLKPIFVLWTTLLAQLPLQVFFTVWSGGFFGGMSQAFLGKYVEFSLSPFIVIGGIAFILIPILFVISKKFNYQKTEYRFFEDRLEFEEGFFTISKKVIRYKDIKEVTLRRGVLQRANNLGTIYLATMATGAGNAVNPFSALGFSSTSASGISVRDIENPEAEYERIRALVDKADK